MIDKGGVTSDRAVKTIEASSSTHTVTFKVVDEEGGTLTGSYGSTSQTASGSSTATLTVPRGENVTFAAAPALGWELDSWTGVTSSSSLNASLTVDGDTTVTVKFKKVGTVAGSDNNAWKLLKDAVKVADPGATITIKDEIKASGDEGDSGEIEIDKNLTIKRADGATSAVLDANSMSRIFKVKEGKTLTLENLTLTGGKADGTQVADTCGGAIYASNATVKIENCIITDNKQKENGGGIYVESTYTTITNCIFTKNTARDGGGIYINRTGPSTYVVTISGGTIGGVIGQANEATGEGGGIYVGQSCILNLKDSTGSGAQSVLITGNKAANGKGVYAANNATVSMQGGTRIDVFNDVYLYSGSAILVEDALTTTGTVARIKVPENNYTTSTQVLYGSAALLNSQHGKFAVMPRGNQQWVVNRYGFLQPE